MKYYREVSPAEEGGEPIDKLLARAFEHDLLGTVSAIASEIACIPYDRVEKVAPKLCAVHDLLTESWYELQGLDRQAETDRMLERWGLKEKSND